MNRYNKIFITIVLVCSIFMCIGYASINSLAMNVSGNVSMTVQDGVFITDTVYSESAYIDNNTSKINSTSGTIMNSSMVLGSDSSSFVTYKVSVYNNSNITYTYSGTTKSSDNYSNDNIKYEVSGISVNDELEGYGSKDFYIKFSYNGTDTSNNTLDSIIKFDFVVSSGSASTGEELVSIINSLTDGGDIILNDDITLTDALNLSDVGDVTIHLNGHSLSMDSLSGVDSSMIVVSGNTNLTLTSDSEVDFTSNRIGILIDSTSTGDVVLQGVNISTVDDCAIRDYGSGTLTINDCDITSTNWAGINNKGTGTINITNSNISGANFGIKSESGTVNLYSGEIISTGTCANTPYYAINNSGTMNIYDGTINPSDSVETINNTGTMNIYGGTYKDTNFTSYMNSSEYEYTTNSDGYYVVSKKDSGSGGDSGGGEETEETTVEVGSDKSIEDALSELSETGGTIKVSSDMNVTSSVTFSGGKDYTLDLSEGSLDTSSLSDGDKLIVVSGSTNLTIKGDLSSNEIGIYMDSSFTGTVTLDGVTLTTTGDCAIRNAGTGTLYINNSTITSTQWAGFNNTSSGKAYLTNSTINGKNYAINNGGTGIVYVSSGTYIGGTKAINGGSSVVKVSGGSYSSNPSSYLESGYSATLNSTTNYYDVS